MPDPEVTTPAGRVRGRWRGDSAAFLGIPFAEPPVGELRFAAPVPKAAWEGVLDAGTMGATAQHSTDDGKTLIPAPSVPGDSVLNVNVFTPAPREDAALPVLVYIHGGGYVSGSPASPWYVGAAFNRDGVVTVTISYRLGFVGFGAVTGAPSNRGVRDWLLALEWVQQNIRGFGGDPARVTIAGQSAGGGAVLTLLGMPAAQHLFQSVWCMSAALADVPEPSARATARRRAGLLGVTPDVAGFADVTDERFAELQEKATQAPEMKHLAVMRALLTDGLGLGPMVDGELIPRATVASLAAGVGGDKPLVLGTTDDEFTMVTDGAKKKMRLVPAGIALGALGLHGPARREYLAANRDVHKKGTAAVAGRFATDRIFRSLVPRVAAARAKGPAPTWAYRFSWVSPTIGWACHCLDVPFFFDHLDAPKVAKTAGPNPPAPLADAVHGSAVSFIRTGDPGWPVWTPDTESTRVFGGAASAPDVIRYGYASVAALL